MSSLILAFSDGDDLLTIAILLDLDEALLCAGIYDSYDLTSEVREMGLGREVKVLLELTFGGHDGDLVILVTNDLHFSLRDDRARDHITGTEGLIILLVREDVLGGNHGFGGTVLGSRESGNLARVHILHDDEGARLHAASFSKLLDGGSRVTLFKSLSSDIWSKLKLCIRQAYKER